MRRIFTIILITFSISVTIAQVLNTSNPQVQAALGNAQVEGSPLANFWQKRTPMMDILFPLIKDDDGIERHYVGAEIGSAYISEEFQPGKVFYNNQELGDVYYRLNAYNNEVELKKTSLDDEKPLALIKNEEVKIVDGPEEILFRTFIDDKGKTYEGYLTVLRKGKEYHIYRRVYKKFTEPKPAANSMVAPTPSRFTDYEAYYFQKSDEEEIVEIPLKTKRFLKLFDEETAQKLKQLIKEKDLNLDNENDLISIFQSLD